MNADLAAWAFVTGALDALMTDDERALLASAETITPISASGDDRARASFDRAGCRAGARNKALDRIKRTAGARQTFRAQEAA